MSNSIFNLLQRVESHDATDQDFYEIRAELAYRLRVGLMSYSVYDDLSQYVTRLEKGE